MEDSDHKAFEQSFKAPKLFPYCLSNGMMIDTPKDFATWFSDRPDPASQSLKDIDDELNFFDAAKCFFELVSDGQPTGPPGDELLEVSETLGLSKDELRSLFDARRKVLLDTTTKLSQDRARCLSFTDFPTEILDLVLGHFNTGVVPPGNDQGKGLRWEHHSSAESCQKRQILQNLRLVCRRLRDLATPLLFSVLAVVPNKVWKDRLEKMVESTHLAFAVCGIQVSLEYRPGVSSSKYSELRTYALSLNRRQCEANYDSYYYQPITAQNQSDANRAAQELTRSEILKHYVVGLSQPLFHQGYTEYRRLHKEQREILQVGCFGGALVKAAANMPKLFSLNFAEFDNPDWFHSVPTASLAVHHLDIITRWLATPFNEPIVASSIQNNGGPVQRMVVDCTEVFAEGRLPSNDFVYPRFVSEVLAGLGQTGARIIQLRTRLPSCLMNLTTVCEHHISSRSHSEVMAKFFPLGEVARGCANLEIVDLYAPWSCSVCETWEAPTRTAQHQCARDSFLAAILLACAPRLRSLALTMSEPHHAPYVPWFADAILWDLDKLPMLTDLYLDHVRLSGPIMKSLCTAIGYKMTSIELEKFELDEGNWADVLDIIRDKLIGSRVKESDGGVIGHGNKGPAQVRLRGAWGLDGVDHERAQKYLQGLLQENPLRS
ncbi:hypothetical protein B0J18DRAFT_438675 [Chaetomium sp. MPI-SDFR-AT-0129]|nr:hypothetical protein B0J18DRAFT_438675 [Chaetomium sp. MPI-SDFR-AT-0129]